MIPGRSMIRNYQQHCILIYIYILIYTYILIQNIHENINIYIATTNSTAHHAPYTQHIKHIHVYQSINIHTLTYLLQQPTKLLKVSLQLEVNAIHS